MGPVGAAALLAVLFLAGCGSPRAGRTVVVSIVGNPLGNPDSLYKPATITVSTGDTVKWIDKDDLEHTVTPDLSYKGWSGGSGILRHGNTYSYRFSRAGVYRYQCMVHPNMFGTVRVRGKTA